MTTLHIHTSNKNTSVVEDVEPSEGALRMTMFISCVLETFLLDEKTDPGTFSKQH